ncbi:MAG TPA: biopolymer transporter ExbD [Terriglobia bacterium]|nr:biopolymer transporter ExbD [Terriglobia bacterium]
MAMAVGNKGGTMGEMNVTPLIDVLLVLLIVFMIIVPTIPNGLGALVPQPNKNAKPDPSVLARTIIVIVDANRQVSINQTPVAISDLGARLVDIFKTRNDRVIFVKGDPSLPFSVVAQVIDIAHGAEIDKIGLITKALENE